MHRMSLWLYLYHLIATLFFWKMFDLVQRSLSERGYDLLQQANGWLLLILVSGSILRWLCSVPLFPGIA
jgi:hypothetical protein